MQEGYDQVAKAIRDHVAAFNAQDLQRLLTGLSEDVLWRTSQETFHGRDELASVFRAAFRTIAPRLALRSMLIDQDRAACQLHERLTVDGVTRDDFIAAFYQVESSGVITSAKIYREGSADV